ncbi:MarR family winged helix-turn-helix transcriptional regulator [Streptomyces goshikiensis]|uniref:MarR family winged helix-turn-helix transcriptional regulator n=1 Tax=Streptomyces goshikiensis TaxID=1942 RepID=UPI0038150579
MGGEISRTGSGRCWSRCCRRVTRHSTSGSLVSATQLRLMCLVDRHPGLRMRALAQHLGATGPSMTRLCDRLEAAGFVRRHPGPGDGREIALRLTPAGQERLARIRESRERRLALALDATPADNRGQRPAPADLPQHLASHGRKGRNTSSTQSGRLHMPLCNPGGRSSRARGDSRAGPRVVPGMNKTLKLLDVFLDSVTEPRLKLISADAARPADASRSPRRRRPAREGTQGSGRSEVPARLPPRLPQPTPTAVQGG